MSPNSHDIDIRLEFTPNPNALKYVVDEHILLERGSASFSSASDAMGSPLAEKILAIPGLAACMIGKNFVSVTKNEGGDWEVVDVQTRAVLKAHIQSGQPAVAAITLEKLKAPSANLSGGDVESRVREILDRDIRPAVAMDGGDVVFEKYENGIVYVYMQGSCSGCPSSTATLKMGIETRIRDAVPEVKEVVAL